MLWLSWGFQQPHEQKWWRWHAINKTGDCSACSLKGGEAPHPLPSTPKSLIKWTGQFQWVVLRCLGGLLRLFLDLLQFAQVIHNEINNLCKMGSSGKGVWYCWPSLTFVSILKSGKQYKRINEFKEIKNRTIMLLGWSFEFALLSWKWCGAANGVGILNITLVCTQNGHQLISDLVHQLIWERWALFIRSAEPVMYRGTKIREQTRLLSAILMISFYEQENKMLTGRIKVSAVCAGVLIFLCLIFP